MAEVMIPAGISTMTWVMVYLTSDDGRQWEHCLFSLYTESEPDADRGLCTNRGRERL